MKTYKINYSAPSISDLKGIIEYISNDLSEPQIAQNLYNRIIKAIHSLEIMPQRYSVLTIKTSRPEKLRKMPVGNYVIVYIINEAECEVIIDRVLYGGRDINNILRT